MFKSFCKRMIPIITLVFLLGINSSDSAFATSTNLSYFKSLDLIRKVMDVIKSDFVEENVDEQKLIYGAIEGMLKTLDDPYSRFMEPKSFKEMQTETQGEFGGLGIVITVKGKLLTVISPIEDTPAFKAGIKAGDVIIKIDGKDATDIALHDAVKLLRGPEGSKVTITVYREGDKATKDYTLAREIIKIPSVKYWVVKPDIGYIRLTQFIQTSSEDLEKAMIALEKHKVTAIILDLRNNPGGLLTAAVEVGRKFIPKGDIVSIKGRDGEKNTYSSFFQSHPLLPLVVLINEGSASASEIVAGAVKDSKRGILLGKKSFGKGSVQTVISLNDGSAMALTTALYYTPSGVNIHKKGIMPDIEVDLPKLSEAERQEIVKQIDEEEKKAREAANKVPASGTKRLESKSGETGSKSAEIGTISSEISTPASEIASKPLEISSTSTPLGSDSTEIGSLPANIGINLPELASTSDDIATPSGLIEQPDSFTKGCIQYYIVNKYDTQLQRAVDILKSANIFLPLMEKK
ncbi:MAG: PDZ domain-containing protein [Candidatus Riflebacteria bacterium]|nr:PDZ domain-containing protein [Candidatus Riflebacteria bacterium]